jgi:hypothetical protein
MYPASTSRFCGGFEFIYPHCGIIVVSLLAAELQNWNHHVLRCLSEMIFPDTYSCLRTYVSQVSRASHHGTFTPGCLHTWMALTVHKCHHNVIPLALCDCTRDAIIFMICPLNLSHVFTCNCYDWNDDNQSTRYFGALRPWNQLCLTKSRISLHSIPIQLRILVFKTSDEYLVWILTRWRHLFIINKFCHNTNFLRVRTCMYIYLYIWSREYATEYF